MLNFANQKATFEKNLRALAKNDRVKSWQKIANTPAFAKIYAILALAILLGTTIFWSILGARLHQSNSDQLVNSYLFQDHTTFKGAVYPGTHTFLLKWPLFFLVKLFGFSPAVFVAFTVLTVIVTVSILAAILYRIDRRPLIFGTLCLALASTLLLVPAQPYAGGLLPVNMAMLATRNLEYVVYIAALAIFIKGPRIRSWRFGLAVALMSLLIASDKLFLSLSIGGALISLTIYALARGWNLVSVSVNWLVGGLLAAIGSGGILWWLDSSGITHITNQGAVNPYGVIGNAHNLMSGFAYALLNLATNFGANPAFDALTLRNVPHQLQARLLGLGSFAFLVNMVILLFGILVAYRLIAASLAHNKNKEVELNSPTRLSVLLIWTSLAACIIFAVSNHYYPVDARYLTISIFALFIAIASLAAKKQWRPEGLIIIGIIATISIFFGILTANQIYATDKVPLNDVQNRNSRVVAALTQRPTNLLVGDYWRVLPLKQSASKAMSVLPLADCTQGRSVLTSAAWQPDLRTHRFAYLLSLDKGLTDFPACSLAEVVNSFGRPNASVVIAGSFSNPKEVLLFYDRGAHHSAPKTPAPTQGPATVVPITLDQLPYTSCPVPTIMNIAAHEDDDLLFMSPDLAHDIKVGHCIRTVYITAGDAGSGQFYWLSREHGSETAYSTMLGTEDIWVERIVQVADHQFITIANPRGNSKVSLIFMHLPDGNVKGQGFGATRFESLERLEAGRINSIQAVYSDSSYASDQLVNALASLMHTYQPSEIRTQANFTASAYTDHSDHMAVGRFTQRAYQQYENQQFEGKVTVPLKFYIGYPIHQMPENVVSDDLSAKEAAFSAYARFDSGVCVTNCPRNPVYEIYLKRQYQSDH